MTSKADRGASHETLKLPTPASSKEKAREELLAVEHGYMTAGLDQNAASSSPAESAPLGPVGKTDAIRVLLVEDDQHYRETLTCELPEQGFVVQSFADGASLLGSLDTAVNADVIVLNWDLPKMSGIDLLAQLRRHGVSLPVVFFTGHDLPAHESLAFDKGAVDFIFKSRGVDILVKRLRRVVQAASAEANFWHKERLVCGKLVLRPEDRRAYWNGVDLSLTLGEYKIVHLLASNAGRYVANRAIYSRLRHEGFIAGRGVHGYRQNVRSAIKRIRNKFRECDPEFQEVKNYAAFGYCWGKPDNTD
jgi:two-component system, OmpR family, response regulator ChvI